MSVHGAQARSPLYPVKSGGNSPEKAEFAHGLAEKQIIGRSEELVPELPSYSPGQLFYEISTVGNCNFLLTGRLKDEVRGDMLQHMA